MLATTFNSSAQEDFPIGDGCFSGDTLIGIYHYDTDDGYTIQYVICRSALSGIYVVAIDVY